MKIISLIRKGLPNTPNIFIVGQIPVAEGMDINQDDPAVEKIVSVRAGKLDNFTDAHYIVHFNNSTIRRIIPANTVIDLAYDTAKEEKKGKQAGDDAPELPED